MAYSEAYVWSCKCSRISQVVVKWVPVWNEIVFPTKTRMKTKLMGWMCHFRPAWNHTSEMSSYDKKSFISCWSEISCHLKDWHEPHETGMKVVYDFESVDKHFHVTQDSKLYLTWNETHVGMKLFLKFSFLCQHEASM